MVILVVMAMLIILTTMSAQLGDNAVLLDTQHKIAITRETGYQMARSAVELAIDLLNVDDNNYDGAGDLWAFGSQRLTWEGKPLILEIRDEESRFPLGPLMQGAKGESVRVYEDALNRLLLRNGLPGREAVACLEDWCDADEDVRTGGGEQTSYPDIRVKNGVLDSLDELHYVNRWGPPTLPPPPPLNAGQLTSQELDQFKVNVDASGSDQLNTASGQRQDNWVKVAGGSEWSDWLTLYSSGKVNLNTAPAEVLKCLDENMSETVVQEIVGKRQTNPMKSFDDLRKIAGVDPDTAFRLGKLAGFRSDHFRIRVVVDVRPGRLELHAYVKRGGSGQTQINYWKVN